MSVRKNQLQRDKKCWSKEQDKAQKNRSTNYKE